MDAKEGERMIGIGTNKFSRARAPKRDGLAALQDVPATTLRAMLMVLARRDRGWALRPLAANIGTTLAIRELEAEGGLVGFAIAQLGTRGVA